MCRVVVQALYEKGGYAYLDVRPKVEYEDVGRVAGSVNIPVMNGQKKWSSEKKKKVQPPSMHTAKEWCCSRQPVR